VLAIGTVACGGSDSARVAELEAQVAQLQQQLGGSADAAGTPEAGSESAVDSPALAYVNGTPITVAEFEEAASRSVPESGTSLSEEEKSVVMDELIANRLLYLRALAMGLDTDEKVQRVMVNTLLREHIYADVSNADFTQEVLQAWYDEHRDDYVIPEKVQIKRIVIDVTGDRDAAAAMAEAERIRGEVLADEGRFRELAARSSSGPLASRGGDAGFVSREGRPGLDSAIVERAFDMSEGEVSEVFETEEGYNVIFLARRRARVVRSFQQVRAAVLRKLKNDRMMEVKASYLADLYETWEVTIDSDRLAEVEVQSDRRGGLGGRRPTLNPGGERPRLPANVTPSLGN
jgi:parvulin-like peptidyl-prolyl isomerase